MPIKTSDQTVTDYMIIQGWDKYCPGVNSSDKRRKNAGMANTQKITEVAKKTLLSQCILPYHCCLSSHDVALSRYLASEFKLVAIYR